MFVICLRIHLYRIDTLKKSRGKRCVSIIGLVYIRLLNCWFYLFIFFKKVVRFQAALCRAPSWLWGGFKSSSFLWVGRGVCVCVKWRERKHHATCWRWGGGFFSAFFSFSLSSGEYNVFHAKICALDCLFFCFFLFCLSVCLPLGGGMWAPHRGNVAGYSWRFPAACPG